MSIYSGLRLDVDAARGLIGECDFILSATPPVPGLRAPLVAVVEATENDIVKDTWRCIARMAGVRVFNERAGRPIAEVHGCVTDGEVWQFLRLAGDLAVIDRLPHELDNVGSILSAFAAILGPNAEASKLA